MARTLQALKGVSPTSERTYFTRIQYAGLLAFCLFVAGLQDLSAQNMSVNNDGAEPDPSAMLDVSDTASGFLMPRMTEAQRMFISSPANGLMIYQTDGSLGLYTFDGIGNNWHQILDSTGVAMLISNAMSSSNDSTRLTDADNDTKIQVEKFTDEDIIRFDLEGTEYIRFEPMGRIDISNSNNSVFIGGASGDNISTGTGNTFMGFEAGSSTSNGGSSVYIGYQAGKVANADGNSIIGSNAGDAITGGDNNTMVGRQAGSSTNTGESNTFIGHNSGRINSTGVENTFIGAEAGDANNGDNNVFLGFKAGSAETTASNLLYIENSNAIKPLIWGDFTSDSLVFNGLLTLDAAKDGSGFTFPGSDGSNGQVMQTDGNGNVSWVSTGVSQNLSSVLSNGNDAGADTVFNMGALAIGTSTTTVGLTVSSTDNNDGISIVNSAGNNSYLRFYEGISVRSYLQMQPGSGDFVISNNDAGDLVFRTGSTERMIIDPDGNVGIGTPTAGALFEVNGRSLIDTLNINGLFTFPSSDGTGGQVMQTDGSGTVSWVDLNPVALVDTDSDTRIEVERGTDDDTIHFDMAGTEYFKMGNGRLEVINTGRSVFMGELAGRNDDLTTNNNVFIGDSAGFTNTTGDRNTFIGASSGANANSGQNTAIGESSMRDLTSGFANVVVGDLAMLTGNGNGNAVLGSEAFSRRSGDENVAVGSGALGASSSTLAGNRNTAVGFQAGTNNSGSNNIIIGYQAGSFENFSDKLWLGTQSSAEPLIWGDLANDSVKVFGSLSVGDEFTLPTTDGTNGQVMQTDGSGNVTWETFSSTSGAGQTDFIAKWSNSSTLDTSLIQDDGTTVSIGTAPSSSGLLLASTSDNTISAAIRAEHNLNSSATAHGVAGYSASSDGNNAAGVFGRADNGAYAIYGQQQSSAAGTVAINGYNSSGGSNANYGVKGQTSSSNASSAGIYGFAFHGGNAILAQSNARVIEASASGARTSSFSAIELSNTATSSSSAITKTGLSIQNTGNWSGTGALNIGLDVKMSGGTTNYAALFNGGNVGIGTSSPSSLLHIESTTTTARQTIESSSGDDAEISLQSGSNEWLIDFDGNQNAAINKALIFSYDANKILTIQGTTGYVGIGTTAPTELLEVNGRALIDTLEINGVFTLPSEDGTSGQVLETDGNGVVTWEDAPDDGDWVVSGGIVANTTNRFGFGTNSIPSSYFAEMETPSGSTYATGLFLDHNYTGAAQQFGVSINLSNASTGQKFGIYNTVAANSSQSGDIYGQVNSITGANAESVYGVANFITTNGTSSGYGSFTTVTSSSANTSAQYGSRTTITNAGTGFTYGSLNSISASSVSSTADAFGSNSTIVNLGSGATYGSLVTISGVGSGARFGAFLDLSAPSGAADSTVGVHQRMNVDGSGNAYGTYVDYSQATGTGTHYGYYTEGEDRNYFSGKVGIGTSNPAYKLSVETATNNYGIQHTDGSISLVSYIDGTAAWFGTVTAHPLYFYTDDGNSEMAIDVSGNVSIGNAHTTATSKLDVAGDIETSGEFYFGDPTTDGSWRIIQDGNNLVFQRRELGVWTDKTAITP